MLQYRDEMVSTNNSKKIRLILRKKYYLIEASIATEVKGIGRPLLAHEHCLRHFER